MTAMVWRLLLTFSILQIVLSSCPSGFDLVSNGECRGSYANISSTYENAIQSAIDDCAGILGQPVIIHNQEEQSFWAARSVGTFPAQPLLLLGIVCNSSSKRYEWADGSAIDFKSPKIPYLNDLNGDCTTTTRYSWFIESNGEWQAWGGYEYMVDISCTVPLHNLSLSPDECDSFEDDNEDGVCYQENSFVRRLAVSKGAVTGLFLGATLSGKGKEFGWIDGSEWDYDNFSPGFPITGFGDCLAMDTSTPSGQWMNIECSAKLPVACVRKQRVIAEPTCSPGPFKEGTIVTSPGFPYTASTPCDFYLMVDEGKKVEMEIILLEANSCCDSLILYDGQIGGVVLANLTGEIHNSTYTTTSLNVMKVSWHPKGGIGVMGFAMTFRGV